MVPDWHSIGDTVYASKDGGCTKHMARVVGLTETIGVYELLFPHGVKGKSAGPQRREIPEKWIL